MLRVSEVVGFYESDSRCSSVAVRVQWVVQAIHSLFASTVEGMDGGDVAVAPPNKVRYNIKRVCTPLVE